MKNGVTSWLTLALSVAVILTSGAIWIANIDAKATEAKNAVVDVKDDIREIKRDIRIILRNVRPSE